MRYTYLLENASFVLGLVGDPFYILLNVTLDGKTDPFDRVVLTIKLIFIFSLKDYRLCFRFIDPVIFGNLPKEIIT